MSSNSGFFFSLIASFTVPHTSSWLTLTGKIWSVGVWITQQKRLVSGMVENLLTTVYSTDRCLYCNIWSLKSHSCPETGAAHLRKQLNTSSDTLQHVIKDLHQTVI